MASLTVTPTLTGPMFESDTADRALVVLQRGTMLATEAIRNAIIEVFSRGRINDFGVNTGTLKKSIGAETRIDFTGRLVEGVVGSPLIYAPVIEYGRSPGTYPPLDAIRLWVKRKLRVEITGATAKGNARTFAKGGVTALSQAITLESMAVAIQRSIQRRGFAEPHRHGLRMFEKGEKASKAKVDELLRLAVELYRQTWNGAEA